jgi:hypothetical protein
MSKNTDLTKLDWYQAAKRVIQDNDDAFRVVVAAGTEFEIGLDASEDSVAIKALASSAEVSYTQATPTGEMLVLDSTGFQKVQLFTKNTSAVTGPQAITVEVSPVTGGDFWVATTATVTPGTALNATAMSGIVEINALRVRLVSATQISSGQVQAIIRLKG